MVCVGFNVAVVICSAAVVVIWRVGFVHDRAWVLMMYVPGEEGKCVLVE